MRIKEMLSRIDTNQSQVLSEKVNPDSIKKEIDAIVNSLQGADKSLYSIATILQQNDMFDIRKDILAFIANINDMYEYLVVELMAKVNPPEPEEEAK